MLVDTQVTACVHRHEALGAMNVSKTTTSVELVKHLLCCWHYPPFPKPWEPLVLLLPQPHTASTAARRAAAGRVAAAADHNAAEDRALLVHRRRPAQGGGHRPGPELRGRPAREPGEGDAEVPHRDAARAQRAHDGRRRGLLRLRRHPPLRAQDRALRGRPEGRAQGAREHLHVLRHGRDLRPREATDKILAVNAALEKPLVRTSTVSHASVPTTSKIDLEAASNVGRAGYMGFVKKLKEHIVDGDIFQAVPSQRLAVDLPKDVTSLDLYRQMRAINPSPYMFFLDMGEDFQIVGASPEMLVKVDHDRVVETHPIAGTRHRGANDEEDDALEKDLLADEKERAEHIMLVDLGRNDVGRVAKPGSVRVERLMQIEKYSHVMHIVSVVKGDLREDRTVYDAYRAMFPAGTLSGAPKVRAMELICSLETERRGVYSGSVGYFSFSGFLDTAIAIRTMVVKDGKVYSQAGGGIVYDSDPQAEYMETVNKLGSAVKTLEKCAAHMTPSAQ
ncbi:hypothetical protein ON010_g5699 [Phytophthora cinnamomi]|nr:hypothetical protein ON010_g5699 [Phytophthora cinnamomi]